MIKVGEHDAYLATPPESAAAAAAKPKAAILYIPDVIGIWANSMLLADRFAAEGGYATLVIDIFRGDAIPMNEFAGTDLAAWLAGGSSGESPHQPPQIDPVVARAVAYLRGEMGFERVGAVGYCFGGKYVVRHLAGDSGVDAGFIAHPSFVEEDEVAAVAAPLSVAAAETDAVFTRELRARTEEILRGKGNVYQVCLYSGVEHGFAVRRGVEDRAERFAMDQALRQAVAFMDAWLE